MNSFSVAAAQFAYWVFVQRFFYNFLITAQSLGYSMPISNLGLTPFIFLRTLTLNKSRKFEIHFILKYIAVIY